MDIYLEVGTHGRLCYIAVNNQVCALNNTLTSKLSLKNLQVLLPNIAGRVYCKDYILEPTVKLLVFQNRPHLSRHHLWRTGIRPIPQGPQNEARLVIIRGTPIYEPDLLPQVAQIALLRKHEPPTAPGRYSQGRPPRRRDRNDGHDGARVLGQLGEVVIQRIAEDNDARRVDTGGRARAEVRLRVPLVAQGGV